MLITLTEEMFSTGKPAAQGEVLIWMKKYAPPSVIDRIGADFQEMSLKNDMMIIGHSESGHHHVLEPVDKTVPFSKAAQALIDGANDMFMELRIFRDCAVKHLREFDTHQGFSLPPGKYIRGIRQEQANTPEGWKRVED